MLAFFMFWPCALYLIIEAIDRLWLLLLAIGGLVGIQWLAYVIVRRRK